MPHGEDDAMELADAMEHRDDARGEDVRGVVRFVEHQLQEILDRHGPWLSGEVRKELGLLVEAIGELAPPPTGRVIHVSFLPRQAA